VAPRSVVDRRLLHRVAVPSLGAGRATGSSFRSWSKASIYAATPLAVLKDWLAVRIAKDRALTLPRAFQKAEFAFSGGVLGGATQAPARWLQAVELTATAMTDAVSKPYIERHFPAATKAAMDELVKNVLAAMDRRLANLSWMTSETRPRLGFGGPHAGLCSTLLSRIPALPSAPTRGNISPGGAVQGREPRPPAATLTISSTHSLSGPQGIPGGAPARGPLDI
jgi:hypothetical protein